VLIAGWMKPRGQESAALEEELAGLNPNRVRI